MESKNELKETDVKSRTCYYFDDIMRNLDVYSGDILLDEKYIKHTKIFQFIAFHTKLLKVQYHCVLDQIKQVDLLKFMMELYIQ